jgi:hypothetical protein
MMLQRYPKSPPFPRGCAECLIAQCNTQYASEEQGVRTPLGWVWSCRELNHKIVQDFNECPIVDLGYFQRQELFRKYNYTQGEN